MWIITISWEALCSSYVLRVWKLIREKMKMKKFETLDWVWWDYEYDTSKRPVREDCVNNKFIMKNTCYGSYSI